MTDHTPIKWVVHDSNGRIVRHGTCPAYAVEAQKLDDAGVVIGEGTPDAHYVKDGQILEKTTAPIVVDGMRAYGIRPLPAVCTVNGKAYDVTEDHIDFSFSLPGEYRVVIRTVEYLDFEFTLTV
jgi:hypothetical protein